jgi:hypothetical protein
VKSKLRALVLKVVFIYATLFPSSGLIQDLDDYTSKAPEDMDDHMFI